MSVLNVNPTRMVLLELKRRVKSANRGHKLLKDKQDGLMQHFLQIIRTAKDLRIEVEEALRKFFELQMNASSLMPLEMMMTALMETTAELTLDVTTRNVMSVRIPEFSSHQKGSAISYGFLQTNGDLDIALTELQKILEKLLKLAEIEKSAESLAVELETTRRRVNALEHKLIPDLQETVKFISMKLGESERGAIVNTMIIKKRMEEESNASARK